MKRTGPGKKTVVGGVFRDPSILEQKHVPSRIQHRNKQIMEMTYYLSSFIRYGILMNNIVVFGAPGTGKTHSVQRMLANLAKDINAFYTRAYRATSAHAFFRSLLQENFELSLHPRESISVYYGAFEKAVRGLENVLFVFDDIQYLLQEDQKGLYGILFYLSRLEKNLGLILIGNIIVNDLSLALQPPTKSSLKLRSVYFPKYNANELNEIVSQRARDALEEKAFERSKAAISLIAGRTAKEWGSARRALDLLKEAGMVSEEIFGMDYISQDAVDQAEEMLDISKLQEQVRDLPQHPLSVLEAVFRSKGNMKLSTGEVYSGYAAICRERRLEPFSLRKISDIITELASAGLIGCRQVSRGKLGRTRYISWLPDPGLEKVYAEIRQVF